ncbi:uncharacterized protein NPIL_661621 [Nephila pilipes]|uniref:Uncharacterized protein n=1 Tax=Nephila pilipes TaxID=299642 RepID=A0A8X6QDN3_NEPPI|nr:uncharacterized protein NPIL_661621 [Nephila pilipes]
MSEDLTSDYKQAVDVFTHSSTGFPGAWSEEEIMTLLASWQEVLEATRPTTRRLDIAQKILKRLRSKNFRRVDKEDIKKQIRTLRTEYKVYQGLLKIGLKTVRAPCVDIMERIFDRPLSRNRLDSTDGGVQLDGVSEDSDHSRRLSVSYEGEDTPQNRQKLMNGDNRNEEVSNQKPRLRFQRRANLQGLIRVMVGQQRTLLDSLDKLFHSLEASNSKLVILMESFVTYTLGILTDSRSEEKVND